MRRPFATFSASWRTSRPLWCGATRFFKKLELTDADVSTVDQIVETILANKMIMQRPVVVVGDTAIIGRPKERIRELLGG